MLSAVSWALRQPWRAAYNSARLRASRTASKRRSSCRLLHNRCRAVAQPERSSGIRCVGSGKWLPSSHKAQAALPDAPVRQR